MLVFTISKKIFNERRFAPVFKFSFFLQFQTVATAFSTRKKTPIYLGDTFPLVKVFFFFVFFPFFIAIFAVSKKNIFSEVHFLVFLNFLVFVYFKTIVSTSLTEKNETKKPTYSTYFSVLTIYLVLKNININYISKNIFLKGRFTFVPYCTLSSIFKMPARLRTKIHKKKFYRKKCTKENISTYFHFLPQTFPVLKISLVLKKFINIYYFKRIIS